jgi:hypothetical protein
MVLGTIFSMLESSFQAVASIVQQQQQERTAVVDPQDTDHEIKAATNATKLPLSPIIVVEGIELPTERQLEDGTTLYRNGHGIRRINFFGMDIKIYVAHLYSYKPIVKEEQIISIHEHDGQQQQWHQHTNNPLHFDFTFLRHVGQSQVVSAWTKQLDYSVTYTYDGYDADRQRFITSLSSDAIEKNGTQTVQIVGDETKLIHQGRHTGTIYGTNFQRSFLSMWFGPKAVANDLKQDLLQGHNNNDDDNSSSPTTSS